MNKRDSDTAVVADVMSAPVITVDPETGLGEVARALVENRISGLPVVDLLGHILGVITEADLLPKEEEAALPKSPTLFESAEGRRFRTKHNAATARQAMTAGAVTVDPDCSLRTASQIMDSRRLRRLLVVAEDEGLVGVVSRRDIIREFTRADAELRGDIVRRLRQDVGVAAIRVRVSVENNEVELNGVVSTNEDQKRVRTLVAATRGVLAVRDRTRVDDGRGTAMKALLVSGSD